MTDRTPQTKGVLRVFGYDPEGPEAPPKAAPSVQPVWSQQDIDDWAKSMGGPWFIPPCYVAVPERVPFDNRDFKRIVEMVEADNLARRLEAESFKRRLQEMEERNRRATRSAAMRDLAPPPELLDKLKAAAKQMTWADSVNAAYAHINGSAK